MAAPLRTDAPFLLRRMNLMLARQLNAMNTKQRSQRGLLDADDVRTFKALTDSLSDVIRLKRQIDLDVGKELVKLPKSTLEALAREPERPAKAIEPAEICPPEVD